MSVPSSEPTTLTAGDFVTWSRVLSDYPASSSWVLSYAARGLNLTAIGITAAASGADHLVEVLPAVTATWLPGKYTLAGYVTKALERYTIYSAVLDVFPNIFADAATVDRRSHAQKVITAIESVLEGYASSDVMNWSIDGGIAIGKRSTKDLLALRDYYRMELQVLDGTGGRHKILTRFTIPA